MAKTKKNTVKISKNAVKLAAKIIAVILLLAIISYAVSLVINFLGQSKINALVNERNLYCNTTWQYYINTEVVTQMISYNATNCECAYQNIYTMDELASMCLCSCDLYDLNGTLITNDFKPLFSATK